MAKRQSTLPKSWSRTSPKKARLIDEASSSLSVPEFDEDQGSEDSSSYAGSSTADIFTTEQDETSVNESQNESLPGPSRCTALCCSAADNAFQPTDKKTLASLTKKRRTFQPHWFKRFPWLSICTTDKKVYCICCRYSKQNGLISFSKMGEKAFTETGFENWKKAVEKFSAHSGSQVHREANLKWMARGKPTIESQLASQLAKAQMIRRQGLMLQLRAMVFLARQGIPIRGHTESEGNLHQLMQAWSKDNDVLSTYLQENRYSCHQFVNELLEILGLTVLRNLLQKMKEVTGPAWFSIIADEATDVCNSEQLNLSIRWVSDDYEVHEDPLGLCRVPDTKADTLFKVLKDLLIRCNLPLALCRGQAYDGAANMQGRRSGVATRILEEEPAALPVHCLAHSLNLCLQDASKQIVSLRDAIELCREIYKLIEHSPKRSFLFSSNLSAKGCGTSLKPLCPTRWTVRTAAIDAILKDYVVLMETLEDIHSTTHDEYGLKAHGFLHSLESFSTLFSLKLAHTLFSAAEQVSKALQKKNITLQDALAAVDAARAYYSRLRSDEEFDRFFGAAVSAAEEHKISGPELPRFRHRPSRIEDGSMPHEYPNPKAFDRHIYNEACDLLSAELEHRFKNQHIPSVLAIEQILLKAANGSSYQNELSTLEVSCYKMTLIGLI